MTTKEEVKNYIKDLESQIQKLEADRADMVKKLKKFPLSKAEQLQNVLNYGGHSCWYLHGNSQLLEDYFACRNRHETIQVEDLIYSIIESNICETYEDQKEVEAIFGNDDYTQEMYENQRKYHKTFTSKEAFFQLADDIIKENVKSFEYDW